MTITMFLVLILPSINCYFKHVNLVVPAFQDGILMAKLVNQYPYDSGWWERDSSKPKQGHYEKQTDSRVRLVRKRMVHLNLGEKIS